MASSLLKEWASKGALKSAVLSEDGKSLSLDGSTLKGDEIVDVVGDDRTCRYSVASIYLQILDPNQGLIVYRNACKKYKVADPVKALDKKIVVGFFVGGAAASAAAAAAPPPPPEAPRDDRKKHKKHDKKERRHHKDKKRPPPPAPPSAKKKEKKVMTTENLLGNLDVVVGKREGFGEDAELAKALSAEGFALTPEMIKESIADIVSLEIPVGNSASILRPAPGRDFQRVLDLYAETEKKKRPPSSPSLQRPHLVGKKPIIIVPKAMTSPVTMWNAHEFLSNARFVPRDVLIKQGMKKNSIQTIVSHKLDARRGGAVLDFELMDNPTTKLGHDMREWDRIVAVISLGASWQFTDWPRGYSKPVELFSRVFGFYLGLEGNKIPTELSNWAVKQGTLSRDKRGLDSVCFANFWDGLEDRMLTKKPEFIPQKAE